MPKSEHQPAIEERLGRLERQMEQLLASQEQLLRLLRAERRPGLRDLPELVSARAAAKALGVSRGRTLASAIRDRCVRTVEVKGRRMVPRAELERVAAEGLPKLEQKGAPSRRRTRAPRPKSGAAARIAEIDLDAL